MGLCIMVALPHVAPRAGAWIETQADTHALDDAASHLVRVRGLKLEERQHGGHERWSHLVRVRGLKCSHTRGTHENDMSYLAGCVD